MSFTDRAAGFKKSHLPTACFTHQKKQRKNHAVFVLVICCLTSNAYRSGYALSTTGLLKTKRSIILNGFWFKDFLLVIDVIKPPGTYLIIDCSFLVDFRSSAILSPPPSFFCKLCWIQFESQQSVFNFSRTNIARQFPIPARFLPQTT